MRRNNIITSKKRTAPKQVPPNAFTLVEVIIALVVASISVLALLKLHIVSIGLAESAQVTSQAVFLADQKIAETLALGYPELGTSTGCLDKNGLSFNWQTEVADSLLPQLNDANVAGLRKISVEVTWKQGLSRKQIQMSTYVADRKLQ